MKERSVLGKGVGALLPTDLDLDEEEKFFLCDIDKIVENPDQPRRHFDPERLEALSKSIAEKGVIQPLVVTRGRDRRYQLVAGERRLRAARMAGLREVPVVFRERGSGGDDLEVALVENIQRDDLSPIEEAMAYDRLMREFHLTQEQVAAKVGKSRSAVANTLRLLQLPRDVREDLMVGRLSEGHARVLLRFLDEPQTLRELREMACAQGMSVRRLEQEARRRKSAPAKRRRRPAREEAAGALPDEYVKSRGQQLANLLETKVRIVQNGSRGKVEIEYYSRDDLERLLALLGA